MPSPDARSPLHAMSIDVEDYFHVAALSHVIKPSQWDSLPSRVVQNTERLLELFKQYDVKSTFFVLGWVAERFPDLIRKLSATERPVTRSQGSHFGPSTFSVRPASIGTQASFRSDMIAMEFQIRQKRPIRFKRREATLSGSSH